jgi:vancomycin permeability regulator SanA
MPINKNLDALVILGDPNKRIVEKRVERALEEYERRGAKYIVITGGHPKYLSEGYKSESEIIYQKLREKGIKPSKLRVESRSNNTIENVINALHKVKIGEIGFVSNPYQLERVHYIVERGKKEGEFDSRLKIEKIDTVPFFAEKLYEFFASYGTRRQLKEGFKSKFKENKLTGVLKRILIYARDLFIPN